MGFFTFTLTCPPVSSTLWFPDRIAPFLVTWEKNHYISLYGNCSISEMLGKSLLFQLRTKADSVFLFWEEREATGAAGNCRVQNRLLWVSRLSPAGSPASVSILLTKEHKCQSRRPQSSSVPKRQWMSTQNFPERMVSGPILRRAGGRWRTAWRPDGKNSEEYDGFVTSWDPYSIHIWWFVWLIHYQIFFQTGNPWIMHWEASGIFSPDIDWFVFW